MGSDTSRAGLPWGDVTAEQDATWHEIRVGPLTIWLQRSPVEWRLAVAHGDGDEEDSSPAEPVASPPDDADLVRFGFSRSPDRLRLHPVLADRPLVVSPAEPFLLPPREEIVLYVSLPVWVVVTDPIRSTVLLETPVLRPSDTWFGPSTRVGELCYAVRSRARTRMEDVLRRTHRAVATVRIANQADTLLPVERLRLPAPQMSVFAAPDGQLWTESVTLVRSEDDELASIQLGEGPPDHAAGATALGRPRQPRSRGLLERTFGGIIRELRG